MIEVKSRKTGKVSILSDEEYEQLKSLGWAGRYKTTEFKSIRAIIPMPPMIKPTPPLIKKIEAVKIKESKKSNK